MSDRAVYKSTAAEFLDDLFSGTPAELEAAFESSLDLIASVGDGPLSRAVARLVEDGALPPDAVEDSEKGWRAGGDVDRVIRVGYGEAIRLARARTEPVPIETLWVTGVADDFEIHICEGKRHITVVLFIPLVRAYGSRRASAKSWVVRTGALVDAKAAQRLDDESPPVMIVQMSGGDPTESAS